MVEIFDDENCHGATFDMSQLFDQLSVAKRKITIDNTSKVHIEDNLQAETPCTARWTMATTAQAQVLNNREILLSQNGKHLIVRTTTKGAKPFVISNDPPHDYDAPNKNSRRVGFDLSVRKKALFVVELIPIH